MQRIEAHEGETGCFGGHSVVWAHARGGRLVGFIATEWWESEEDAKRAAKCFRARLDKTEQVDKDTG